MPIQSKKSPFKERLFEIIFKTNTKAGKIFEVLLMLLIILSVITVLLESVNPVEAKYGEILTFIEWCITLLFTLEFIIRLSVVRRPLRYLFSFYGIIDLLSCLPAYLMLITTSGSGLILIRSLRLIRLFRVFQLSQYTAAGSLLFQAMKASRFKIAIFLHVVLMLIIIIGALMFFIEGEASGFDSIPRSMYWVVVTITTVGYGDIAPQTIMGQLIASVVMILGYAIIAVPTGIVTVETSRLRRQKNSRVCTRCKTVNVASEVNFCVKCGEKISH